MAPTLGDIILAPIKFTGGETGAHSIMELALVHSNGKYILRLYSQVHTCAFNQLRICGIHGYRRLAIVGHFIQGTRASAQDLDSGICGG